MLDQPARGLRERLGAPRLDLDLRGDQLARRVLAQRDGVGARLELGEAVDQAVRLGVDDLELLLDREGEILRAGEVIARLVEREERVGDALAHRRERTSAFVLQTRERSADTARVERSRRSYFLLLGMACASAGPRAVGRAADRVRLLEAAWTLAEHAARRADSYVR